MENLKINDAEESDLTTDCSSSTLSLVTPPHATGYNLSFDELQHLFSFFDLREVIICESFGNTFREAAQHHYAKRYKTLVLSHELINERDAYEDLYGQRVTLWQHFTQLLPFGREVVSGKVKQLRDILVRVGPFVRNLTFLMNYFESEECISIGTLLRKYCTSIRTLRYIGPSKCCMRDLARVPFPEMNLVESLEFRLLYAHTDATIKPYLAQCSSHLTTLSFDEMKFTGACLKNPRHLTSLTFLNVGGLRSDKLVRCIRHNSATLSKFHMENKQLYDEVPIDAKDLLAHIPRIKSLRLSGQEYGQFSRVNDLSCLTELELCCSNATELNRFFCFLPAENLIEKLNVTINCELSIGALDGFSRFHRLHYLKLRMTNGSLQLNDICRNFNDNRRITTFELIDHNETDCDLAEPCFYLRNVEKLRVTLHKNAINLKAIAGLNQLKHLYLHLSTCLMSSYVQTNNGDVNELLQILSRKNSLASLKLHLSSSINLSAETITALAKLSCFRDLTYRGCVPVNSFFYELGQMQNITSLTYVMVPMRYFPGAKRLDPIKMKMVVEQAKNLKLFTIVLNELNDVDAPFRVLLDVRPGFQVRVKGVEFYEMEGFE